MNLSGLSRGAMTRHEHVLLVKSILEASKLDQEIATTFIEVGIYRCGTSVCVAQVLLRAKRKARFLGVDINPLRRDQFAARVIAKTKDTCVESNIFTGSVSDLLLSTSAPAVGSCAWIFLDHCHCEECVARDIPLSENLLAPGGMILFHDTDPRNELREPCMPYHGGMRRCGVMTAIKKSGIDSRMKLFADVPARQARVGGGLRVYANYPIQATA